MQSAHDFLSGTSKRCRSGGPSATLHRGGGVKGPTRSRGNLLKANAGQETHIQPKICGANATNISKRDGKWCSGGGFPFRRACWKKPTPPSEGMIFSICESRIMCNYSSKFFKTEGENVDVQISWMVNFGCGLCSCRKKS